MKLSDIKVNAYQLTDYDYSLGSVQMKRVDSGGRDYWRVAAEKGGWLGHDGNWHDPYAKGRDQDGFLLSTRWESPADALAAYIAATDKVVTADVEASIDVLTAHIEKLQLRLAA